MTPDQTTPHSHTRQEKPGESPSTVQVLVANEGNRTAIRNMLVDEFEVDTSHSVEEADLYLVEDRLFPEYRDELRKRVNESNPAFCPVVIIRRDEAIQTLGWRTTDEGKNETLPLVDEFVEAPLNQQLLVSRLRSLLVRRQQSLQLQTQVKTLGRQERELRRFEHAIEDSGTATAITDTDGAIEYVNPEFEELTGYGESTAIGQPLRRFLSRDSQEIFDGPFWRTITDEGEWEGELLIEQKNSQHRITDTTITPIRDDAGESEGFVVVMPDITQRIAREQLLQDREQELDLLRQILSRYLRHNLRNDLNIIKGYTELLKAKLPEQDAQDATKILDTTNRLIETSETARKYSTFIEQESELAPRNVAAIVEGIVSESRKQYSDVSFEGDIPNECYILARDGITEALHALIDNAAQHNTADAPWVRVTVTESDGVQIVIEDNGPGLPELELETLNQGSETALKHSQGIGLWLSKWVIEGVGGRLSFDTMDEGGTRVTIDFPPADQVGERGLEVSDLRAREQRLKTITQRMTDAVIEVDAAWEITFVDEQAENILGVDADAIRGQQLWDVFSDARDTRFETASRDVMQSRSAETIEEYYGGIDGWLESYVYPDFDGGLSFYFRDITERKAREQELEQAHSRMELALEETDAAVWEWDPETDAVTTHPKRDPVFQTELRTGEDFLEAVHPDDRFRVREALETAVETGAPYDVEFRVQADEGVRWAADHGEVQYDDDGDVTRLVGVVRDITERKQREQELSQQRELLDRTERIADVGGWEIDTETMDVFWSDSLYEILGVEHDVNPSLDDALDLYHEEDRDTIENAVETALDSGEQFDVEARIRRADGGVRWLRIQGVPTVEDGAVVTLRGAVQDITKRKQREQELELKSQAMDEAPTGITITDPAQEDNPIIYANDEFARLTGHAESEVLGRNCRFLQGENTIADRVAEMREAIDAVEPVTVELRNYRKDDTEFWNRVSIAPIRTDDTEITHYVGFQQDVTEKKERQRLLKSVFNNTYNLTGVMDLDGTLREANETALSFAGIDREDVVGKPIWETYWFQENQDARETTRKAVTQARQGELFRDEIRVQGRDDVMIIDFTVRPVFDEDGTVTLLIPEGRDITERKQREQQLEAERRRFQSLVDVLPHGVYRADPETLETTYANEAFEQIHGYTPGEWRDTPSLWEGDLHPDDAERVTETFQAHRESKDSGQLEYRIQTADGDTRWVEDTFQWEYDDAGNVTALVGVYTDITKQKEYELHLETIIDNLPGYVYRHEYDSEYPLQFVRGDAETVTGYTATELEEDVILAEDIIHPDDREDLWADHIERIEATGEFDSTYRIITKNGDVRWIRDQGQLLEDPVTGKEVIDGFITDVSDQIQRERELKRQQTFIDESLDALHDVFYAINEDGELIRWNERVSEVSGYTDEEIEGIDVTEFFVEAHHDRIKNSTTETMDTGSSVVRADVRTADGERLPFEFHKTSLTVPDRDEIVAVGVGRDISDQVKREQELERIHDFFAEAERLADLGAWEFDANENIVWTDGTRRIHEVDEDFTPTIEEALDFFHPEDRGTIEQAVDAALENGESFDLELRLHTARGNQRWVRTRGKVLFDEGSQMVRGFIQDITEQKERRQELQNAHAQLENAIEAGAVGTWEWHIQEDRMAVGREFARTFGVEPDLAQQGVALDQFVSSIHEDDRERIEQQIEEAVASCGDYEAEYRVRDADDELHWVLARGHVDCDEDGTPLRFPGVLVDITDRKRIEQQLQQQNERLEEFANIVSHDLRNPLSIANGYLELAIEDGDTEPLSKVKDAHTRMQELIEDILLLAHEGDVIGDPTSVDLESLGNACWKNVETKEASLHVETDREIVADESRLAQLLENLVRNAVEHGGDDVSVTVGALDDGFYVEDDGPGITADDRDEVFDAGYSTTDGGTGLGLAIVKQIADAHGWQIRVTDGSDGGARFEITTVEFSAE